MESLTIPNSINESDIAIISMSCRFPGANNPDEFWHNLRDGVESITFFNDDELLAEGIERKILNNPNYVKAGATISDIDKFDAFFFGFNARDAEITDPQHRLFLECAWQAIESAGYDTENYPGAIGVYAGSGNNSYLIDNINPHFEHADLASNYQILIGNGKDFLPTRVSYKLNLTGPSLNINTACSTSLVVVHLAIQGLLNGECDMALAGGISLKLPQKTGYMYQKGMIFSPDGHCRAFDAQAKGTICSRGLGIVVLKRLVDAIEDGDTIEAVIKGSAINNDGADKVGYTAPSVNGQVAVITEAQAIAGVDPKNISYIEAHGTGTELGDPIEISALTQAFRTGTQKQKFCAIGSVKTNIGHTDAAAGIAGLIKTVLALKHKQIPPSLHFQQANPKIDFENSPFYINTTLQNWQTDGIPRRAGVSSFGIGGTNAHVVLEEAPQIKPSGKSRSYQLLLLSTKTSSALDTATKNLSNYLKQNPDVNLADVAYTLQLGRRTFLHKRMLICQNTENAITALDTNNSQQVFSQFTESKKRPVIFMFSGQGSQYVNMGRELYETELVFRKEVDHCCDLLQPLLNLDLRQLLYPPKGEQENATEQLKQTAITQPALFVIEYALVRLLMSWGITPQAMIGHSIGEYVAACLSGVFSLEDGLNLVVHRGRLMQQLPSGAMLAIPLTESEIQPQLTTELSVAVINNPNQCVVSGTLESINHLEQKLNQQDINCRRLHTSHAFHSNMMEPILELFTEQVKRISLNTPQIPYISNVTGDWIRAQQATDPNYWVQHIRQTVRFSQGIAKLLTEPEQVFLEVGPGRTLSTLVSRHPNGNVKQVILTSLRHPQESDSDVAFLLTTLGKLWLAGVRIDWSKFTADEHRHRLHLPTYPFERQSYWMYPPQPGDSNDITKQGNITKNTHSPPELANDYIAPCTPVEQKLAEIWTQVLGVERVSIHDNFFDLGGDSLQAVTLFAQIEKQFGKNLPLATLFQSGTVAKIAQIIRQKKWLAPWESLVAIQPNGNKPPLFYIHAGGGNLLVYRDLAYSLGIDQPVYGLQPIGLDGKYTPHNRIEDMADHYLAQIRMIQPNGPYFLAGLSSGGTTAWEIAQRLQAQKEKIALLALFDTSGPEYPKLLPPIPRLLSVLNWAMFDLLTLKLVLKLKQLGIKQTAIKILDRLGIFKRVFDENQKIQTQNMQQDFRVLIAKYKSNSSNISPLEKWINSLGILLLKYSSSPFYANAFARGMSRNTFSGLPEALQQVQEASLKANRAYVPQVYPGRVILFRAKERPPGFCRDPQLGWGDLAAGGMEIYEIPGNHTSIMKSPVLAEKLRICLDKAQAKLV